MELDRVAVLEHVPVYVEAFLLHRAKGADHLLVEKLQQDLGVDYGLGVFCFGVQDDFLHQLLHFLLEVLLLDGLILVVPQVLTNDLLVNAVHSFLLLD